MESLSSYYKNRKPYVTRLLNPQNTIWPSKKKQVATIAKRVFNSGTEMKYFDGVADESAISSGGSSYLLTNIPQGATNITRDGNVVRIRSVEVNINMYIVVAAVLQEYSCAYRFVLVLWKSDEDIDPVSTAKIFQDVSAQRAVNTPFLFNTRKKYRILADRRVTSTWTGTNQKVIRIVKKFPGLGIKQSYTDSANNQAFNQISLHIFTDSTAVDHPRITFYSRVLFTDG